MEAIIDAHSHLGDILFPGGGRLIDETGVSRREVFDPVARSERHLHRDPRGLGKLMYRLMEPWVGRAERARNATATLENFRRSLDETEISSSVCLPIPPYVSFADLETAARKDPGVIPFTGVRYADGVDPGPALAADVAAGARGLKLHPILQRRRLVSRETRLAVEAFAPHGLPVLFHCGISKYYSGLDRRRQKPRYGRIRDAAELVRAFPNVRFIAGHSGLFEVREVLERLEGCANVWVETSFQSPETVRELTRVFGGERVLFGSDWPYGNRLPAIAIVREACRGDRGLERRMFHDNAAELLGMD